MLPVDNRALFTWAYRSKSISHGTMFISHNKSASASVKNTACWTQP